MERLKLRTDLDSSFVNTKKKLSYPYIYLPSFGEEIALMVVCVRKGPLPITLSDKGVLKQVGSCELSALELQKLLRVYRYEVVLSEHDRRSINSISDVLEVLSWMVLS